MTALDGLTWRDRWPSLEALHRDCVVYRDGFEGVRMSREQIDDFVRKGYRDQGHSEAEAEERLSGLRRATRTTTADTPT